MKQIFTFLVVALLSANVVHAQITMTHDSHGFRPGDEHACQTLFYKDPGQAGKNVTWDFRDVVSKESIGVSTVGESSGSFHNIGVMRNDGVRFLYNVTKDQVEYRGYERGDLEFLYNNPIVKTKYPQSYGTFFEGAFSGNVLTKGKVTSEMTGRYSTDVDGEGTILLPDGGKLPVIRVKTTKVTNYSCSTHEVVKYLWYAQDVRYPVFVSIETVSIANDGQRTILEKVSYLNTNLQRENKVRSTTDLNAIDDSFTCKASPNPFKERLNIEYTLGKQSAISIEIYNAQGSKVGVVLPKQTQQGMQTINYNTVSFAKGIYFLRFTVDGKVHIEKLIKN